MIIAEQIGDGGRSGRRSPRPVRTIPLVGGVAAGALADAHRCLAEAMRAGEPADRFATAHRAALRAAAALLAALPRPTVRRVRTASVWDQLDRVAPEFAGWTAFFAAGSSKRQAAEAGITRLITAADADDQIRRAAEFVELVGDRLQAAA